jgi:hypothetical protein
MSPALQFGLVNCNNAAHRLRLYSAANRQQAPQASLRRRRASTGRGSLCRDLLQWLPSAPNLVSPDTITPPQPFSVYSGVKVTF